MLVGLEEALGSGPDLILRLLALKPATARHKTSRTVRRVMLEDPVGHEMNDVMQSTESTANLDRQPFQFIAYLSSKSILETW